MRLAFRSALVAFVLAAALVAVAPAGSANECDGLMVCVPVAGPWVAVPGGSGATRPEVRYQVTCPRGYIVGGTDAEVSARAVDVSFLARVGSPVNPGISTRRSAIFLGFYAGRTARSPSFRPHVGCIPSSGGGSRVPTAAGQLPAGEPVTWRVRTVRVRPGTATVTQRCGRRERLVRASHAFGFFTKSPPSASLVASVSASRSRSGAAVVARVRGDAEVGSARVVVQVQAVCSAVA